MPNPVPSPTSPISPEDLSDSVHKIIHEAAQQITAATWTNHSPASTISDAVADALTGHSTFDVPAEQLRELAIAVGTLRALGVVYRASIAELLAAAHIRDVIA